MFNNLFQTSSLNLVAWLLMKGFEVKEKVKVGDQAIFYFERVFGLQDAINAYNQNIELKQFIAQFKKVKGMAKS